MQLASVPKLLTCSAYPYFDELFYVLSYLLLLKGVSLHKRIITD